MYWAQGLLANPAQICAKESEEGGSVGSRKPVSCQTGSTVVTHSDPPAAAAAHLESDRS